MDKDKVGFCFTGEGARGAIQAGIALSLFKKGIKPDFTIGISSGSICASSYCYLGPEGLADLWSSVKSIFSVFRINYNFLWKRGLMNQKPMEKILSDAMKNDPICESVVIRMNIEDGFMDYVSNKSTTTEEFKEAVLASVAITSLVEDRDGWVDAGSRQIAPLEQCIHSGCNKIYVIMGRRLTIDPWRNPEGFLSSLKMGFRAFDIALQEIMIRDINRCLKKIGDMDYKGIDIYLVEPNETFYESANFKKCKDGVVYGEEGNYHIQDKKALQLNNFLKGYEDV